MNIPEYMGMRPFLSEKFQSESPKLVRKILMLVTQSCPTLCNPMDCSPSGSSVHGILQARILNLPQTGGFFTI